MFQSLVYGKGANYVKLKLSSWQGRPVAGSKVGPGQWAAGELGPGSE